MLLFMKLYFNTKMLVKNFQIKDKKDKIVFSRFLFLETKIN